MPPPDAETDALADISSTDSGDDNHVSELATLFPDRTVEVRDPDSGEPVRVTVRAFRYLDGLEAQADARVLIEAIADGIEQANDAEIGFDARDLMDLAARYPHVWIALVARAADREPDWLARLADADGALLSDAMWGANERFFFTRIAFVIGRRRRAASGSLSPGSSTPSSAPATE